MDNISQQADEIEALGSIFMNEWKFNSETGSYCIKISKDVELWITLHLDYPSQLPPKYELLAPTLTKAQKDLVHKEFQMIYINDKGCPIIYQWIEKLKDIVFSNNTELTTLEATITQKNDEELTEVSYEFGTEHTHENNNQNKEQIFSEVIHGPIIVDRKSTFQGHACVVTSQKQFRDFFDYLLENKKIAAATHNISAFRIVNENGVILQDCDDDGETHAGGRLLHLLEILDLKNVAVIVSRWYGGIHLGPDRFKHINNAARQVLIEGHFIKPK